MRGLYKVVYWERDDKRGRGKEKTREWLTFHEVKEFIGRLEVRGVVDWNLAPMATRR